MAMTKDEMAMIAMEIVAYAGDARTKYLSAMDAISEKDFAKAPEAYLTFMRQQWFALMQKQDSDWSQSQTQPQEPTEDDDTAP